MKKITLLFTLSVIVLTSFCQVSNKDTLTKKDTAAKNVKAPSPERDLAGLYLTRGVKINGDGLADGYIMFPVTNSPYVYLINRRGDVVHKWKGNCEVFHAYLMDDGSLVQGAMDPDFPVFGFGGPFGRIQKISWDGKMLWDFEYATEEHIVHHDFSVMANGHVLALAYEAESYKDAIANGRKPEKTPKAGPWLEGIIEIEPEGKTHGKIVWEWHLKDHLIQDFDAKKANYGNPADHPELFDFNLGVQLPKPITQDSMDILQVKGWAARNETADNRGADIFHFNAIRYDSDLNQIVFSSPHVSEIFIIDHSTTTKEAAGHKGGRYGKGGDFLYRWGNPQNYKRGDSTNEQLFGQHDVRWIEKGKPGAGHFTIFDNNHFSPFLDSTRPSFDSINYSAVYEIVPPISSKGNYLLENGKAYGPDKPVWMYKAADSLSFWSPFVSGAARMNNGNTFICEGIKGHFFEVTKEGKMVWEYFNPYHGDIRQMNGDPAGLGFFEFRSTFIPADHPALVNKKLEPVNPQPPVFAMPPPDK